MLRIDERDRANGCATLALCGVLAASHVPELKRLCEGLRRDDVAITLDLADLRSADRAGLAFLLAAADNSVRLASCPPYIRRWIQAERRARRSNL